MKKFNPNDFSFKEEKGWTGANYVTVTFHDSDGTDSFTIQESTLPYLERAIREYLIKQKKEN